MSMRISKARRLATGTAAAALAMGTIAVAGPAVAASEPLNYTCETPLGDQSFIATFDVAPTVPVGGAAKLTTSVLVPDSLRSSLYGLAGARTLEGTATGEGTALGQPITVSQAIPVTPVPDAGDMTVIATGSVPVPAILTPGTVIDVAAGNFAVKLEGKTEDGSAALLSPYDISCVLDPEQNAAIGDITVVQTGSKTKVTAKAKKNKATIKVKVKADTAVSATGKVKIKVKGKKKVTKTVKVNKKGVAKLVVKKLKKGKYKVNAAYAGDSNVKKSKSKATFKIK